MITTPTRRLPRFTPMLAGIMPAVYCGLFMGLVIGSWPQTVLAQLSCPLTQITNTTGGTIGNVAPATGRALSADGTRIAFHSDRDLTGANPEGIVEIFLFDDATNTFTQITNTNTTGGQSFDASLSADGTRIAFMSNVAPTGANPENNFEIFLFDTTTNTFTQITNTTGAGVRNP